MIGVGGCKFGETNKLRLRSIPKNSECRKITAQHAHRYFPWHLDSTQIDEQHFNLVSRVRKCSRGRLTQNCF
jgi:hypothetical protein